MLDNLVDFVFKFVILAGLFMILISLEVLDSNQDNLEKSIVKVQQERDNMGEEAEPKVKEIQKLVVEEPKNQVIPTLLNLIKQVAPDFLKTLSSKQFEPLEQVIITQGEAMYKKVLSQWLEQLTPEQRNNIKLRLLLNYQRDILKQAGDAASAVGDLGENLIEKYGGSSVSDIGLWGEGA